MSGFQTLGYDLPGRPSLECNSDDCEQYAASQHPSSCNSPTLSARRKDLGA